MSSVKYKLTYFNGRGYAEISRYLFALSGVSYDDCRLESPSPGGGHPQPGSLPEKHKYPFGQVPVLELIDMENNVDGQVTQLAQSKSIERYLAQQFGFFGSSDLEAQLIDSIGETIRDLRDQLLTAIGKDTGNKTTTQVSQYLNETLPRSFYYLSRFAVSHSTCSNHCPFIVSKMSLADLQWFNFLSLFDNFAAKFDYRSQVSKALIDYPALTNISNAVQQHPNIAQWIAKRPVTAF